MTNDLLYMSYPLQLEFEATVVEKKRLDNRNIVVLHQTYFFPTGGGQEHDTGKIGDANVVDVYKDDQGKVNHVLDKDLEIGKYNAVIDQSRRFGNMQHHSAQHILTYALQAVLGYETISASINFKSPSTIDVKATSATPGDLEKVEKYANQIVFNDLEIKSYFVKDTELQKIPFRRQPVVSGNIRVVEVDSLDYSACGGTHCQRTGMVGLIKILKTEHKNDKLRVHFAAGNQALDIYDDYLSVITKLAHIFSVGTDMIVDVITSQLENFHQAQDELKDLRAEMIFIEAMSLVGNAEIVDDVKLVIKKFYNKPANELRSLGLSLKDMPKVVAIISSFDGHKISLVVSCSKDTNIRAQELLRKQIAFINGKGGGDNNFAQGCGQISQERLETFFVNTKDFVRDLLNPIN